MHVPFCLRTCPYCDFYKLAPEHEDQPAAWLEALLAEAARDLPATQRFETIFVGGGTPTELPARELDGLLQLLGGLAAPGAEITFESNPGTCDRATYEQLERGGVTRLSIGAQTFSDERLRRLGRIHDASSIGRAVDSAREAGLANLNLDLIFAIPGQTLDEVGEDLGALLELEPDHVSAYCLTFEPDTPFGRAVVTGLVRPLPPEAEAAQMELVRDTLTGAGYDAYEISNFAGAGGRCRHNVLCWSYERYHALGPSAASFVGWKRRGRARNLAEWMRWAQVPPGELESLPNHGTEEEMLDPPTALFEVLLLGLRLASGITRLEVRERSGQDLDEVHGTRLAELVERGWLTDDGERIALTHTGQLLANQVMLALL